MRALFDESLVKFRAVHSGHAKVQHDAPRPLRVVELQKTFRTRVREHFEARHPQEKGRALKVRLVVVHEAHERDDREGL